MDHKEILETAKRYSEGGHTVRVETLLQNIAHLTVAEKEIETRLIRVANKLRRHGLEDVDELVEPLAQCVALLQEKLQETQKSIRKYSGL